MRNRAKCKKCQTVIESFFRQDFVKCSCGEIYVDGGTDFMKCGATDFSNFLRVDDEGNEIVVKVVNPNKEEDKIIPEIPKEVPKPQKKELIGMLESMIGNLEKLPTSVMNQPITHYDHLAALLLIKEIFQVYDT
jgi:hypothetical protein